jgi:branched-chain amino acid transport system substrate-binding protein
LAAVAMAAAAAAAVTALMTGPAGAQAGEEGVTAKSVKLGYIYSGTGVASAIFQEGAKGCQARIDAQNAQGGVNGRKIQLEIVDDQSSGANLTATQDLVTNRHVFAVVNNSSFAFLSYRYLLGAGVPMIGGGYDGNYYGEKGNEDIFSFSGNSLVSLDINYDGVAKYMKQMGATKVAAVGYGISPSSTAAAETTQKYAVPAAGLDAVYTNTTVDFGTTDVGPIVLGIKKSGADAVYMPLQSSTNVAIVQGLAQNGVNMKSNVSASGYSQDLLESPAAPTLGPTTIFTSQYAPVELKSKATTAFQSNLKKYAGVTGVPDYGGYTGYIGCDLAVTGLQHAGQNPTRRGFIDGLHELGTYDAAGLTCAPVDISLKNFGKAPATSCVYIVHVQDGKWVLNNKGKPVIGKLVGSKAALEANRTGDTSALTTTTAPPATTAAPAQ